MRWRWPPWRREEPEVHQIEQSGETVGRAQRQTDEMQQEILGRSKVVRDASHDLTELITRSMRRAR